MAFVAKTIDEMKAFTRAEKKAYLEGDGAPVKPTNYDDLGDTDQAKLSYDESKARNTAQIAGVQDAIDGASP